MYSWYCDYSYDQFIVPFNARLVSVVDSQIMRSTVQQTFLEAELVLAAGLEIVEGYEELGVVLLLGKQVLLGGPARGRLQRQRRGSGGGRLALWQVRDVRQRPALQQRLCNTPCHRQS